MKKRLIQIAGLDFYSYAYRGQYVIGAMRYGRVTIVATVSKLKRYYYTILADLNFAFCERVDISFDSQIQYELDNVKTKVIFYEDKSEAKAALINKLEEIITKSIKHNTNGEAKAD